MKEEEQKSRSQIKRDMLELQHLGERLAGLSRVQLEKMNLPPELLEAVLLAGELKKRGALRRQIRYIGALMRRLDPTPIQETLERLDKGQKRAAWAFKQTEQWRDQLVDGNDDLLVEILDRFPQGDRRQLRQLVLNARKEKSQGRPPRSSRALFRYLRDLTEEPDGYAAKTDNV